MGVFAPQLHKGSLMTYKPAKKLLLAVTLLLWGNFAHANTTPQRPALKSLQQNTPTDIFWHQALKFGQNLEDNIRKSEAIVDELSELHDSKVRAVKGLGPLDYVRFITTKKTWKMVKAQIDSKDDFREEFVRLMQSEELSENYVSDTQLKHLYRDFQALMIDVVETGSAKHDLVCTDAVESLDTHVRETQRLLDKLAYTKGNIANDFWYNKIGRFCWGSTFAHDVVPAFMPVIPLFYTAYLLSSGKISSDASAASAKKALETIGNLSAFQRLKYFFSAAPILGYFIGDYAAEGRSVVALMQQQYFGLYKATWNQVYSGLLGASGPLLQAMQKSEYDLRKKEDEKRIERAKRKVKRSHERQSSFSDIIGYKEAKDDLGIIIDALANPVKFMRWGGQIPKGILLEGPPGTGKTLFARALAGEANCAFYKIEGSDIIESNFEYTQDDDTGQWVESNKLKDIFAEATENSPAIIFIDEIDFIGAARNNVDGKQRRVLSQLLTELDGFNQRNPYRPVLVVAATNCAKDLDEALTRAGRFDLTIHVDVPSSDTRRQLFEQQLPPQRAMDGSVDYDVLAKVTEGFNCADIVGVVKKHAPMHANLQGRSKITMADLLVGVEKVRSGLHHQL